ncbi:flavodoxin family protein [Methanoregula sp.]|uniref:flavodoxin family protein n=1 Tax=Methanoregula sp. TaxID=2052170 RepID=UPI003BAFC3C1
MTQVIAINGSPRTTWNTATLLEHALEGAASEGAEIEIVHLYDLDYKGCTSCFSCKLVGGKSYGKCAVKDGLTPLLEKVANADALILGSPIYVGTATGEMRSFLERLAFPYIVYDAARSSLFPKKMPTGFIYTMGADEGRVKDMGYEAQFRLTSSLLERIFGSSEWIMVTDTLQFDDYSKYVSSGFDPEAKARRRREVFPEDCKKAFEMGKRLGQAGR